jgi:sialate O-acetylesterase
MIYDRFLGPIDGAAMKNIFWLLFACWILPIGTSANVRLASIFGNRMVLQRHAEVPVWGTAQKDEKITVAFADQRVTATANETGQWMVRLAPMSEGGPYEMIVSGDDTVRLSDILVGEVWLCSGQSNMELAVERTTNAKEEIAAARYPMIRLFTVKRAVAESPQESCTGSWSACDSSSVRKFSGAAYYFGRKLFQDLGVPIGLVHSSYGGTPAEAWMSKEALGSDPDFQPILDRWKKNVEEFPEKKKEFEVKRDQLMQKWREDSAKATLVGKAPPVRPQEPIGPGNRSTPSGLYNGMIAPLVPFAFKGVIWYQGESNASRAHQYRKLLPALILDWRKAWQQELPFYYVQLPNLDRQPEPSRSGWAELRESQLMTLRVPRTAMAVTIDVGDPSDLHPANKQDVGHRLALLARGNVYGKGTTTFQGPIFRGYKIEDTQVRMMFDNASSMHARGGKALNGFVIAGADKVFVPAQARIDGSDVLVWSDKVTNPLSVRYAWADNPTCNLVNDADLPASPCRTDDWPEITFGKE